MFLNLKSNAVYSINITQVPTRKRSFPPMSPWRFVAVRQLKLLWMLRVDVDAISGYLQIFEGWLAGRRIGFLSDALKGRTHTNIDYGGIGLA